MRLSLLDYGAGNLHSLQKALVAASGSAAGGQLNEVRIADDAERALDADLLVLPGVGAFGAAASRLATAAAAIRAAVVAGLPVLGICLGMQLLFESSEEGEGAGLGLLPGRVERLRSPRVPQMGWNQLMDSSDQAAGRAGLSWVYYANSFVAAPRDASCVTAWSELDGERFPAIVRSGRIVGVQFHPEKSSAAGVAFLGAVLAECAA